VELLCFGLWHVLDLFGIGSIVMTTLPNKTVQVTPTNAAVLPLRSWACLWYRCGVPDLIR
jgi:hypothetical protein